VNEKMVGVIVPSPESDETESELMQPWKISRSELSAYLLFFDRIGYFSGFRPPVVMLRIGEPYLLALPDDRALQENPLVYGYFSANPRETIAEAMALKMSEGFESAPDEVWVYHPRYFQTNAALGSKKEIVPSIGLSFLDGLWCPHEDVPLDEILKFKEQRASEREAFMVALIDAAENVKVQNHSLVLGVPIDRIEKALAELNRTAVEKWATGAKRSFRWGIRPNQTTLLKLAAAVSSYEYLGNATASVLLALWGTVEFSIDLTPRLEPISEDSRALSYMMDVKRSFENPEAYTRFQLKSPGKRV
jgi:hypothetical protein